MHIISRHVNQGIVFGEQTTVTVVEISGGNVTLEVTRSDGETERVTLRSPSSEARAEHAEELVLASC